MCQRMILLFFNLLCALTDVRLSSEADTPVTLWPLTPHYSIYSSCLSAPYATDFIARSSPSRVFSAVSIWS